LVGSLNGQSWKSVFRPCLCCCLAFKPSLPAGRKEQAFFQLVPVLFFRHCCCFCLHLELLDCPSTSNPPNRARVLLRPGIQSTPSPKLRSFDLLSSHHARHLPCLVACSCAFACKHTLSPAHPLPLTILSSAHPSCRVCVSQHPTTALRNSCRIR
jgi:hypothetical protein